MEINAIINRHLIDCLGIEFTEGALTSFTLCNAYHYFVGQSLLLMSKIGHAENI